jgi:tol-pal system protein YbgF
LPTTLIACVLFAGPAAAQGFNFFNREPPPGPAPMAPPGAIPDDGEPNEATAMVLRLNRLEEQLRQANGRIEELENQEGRLKEQLQRFRQDVEVRLGERAAGEPPSAAAEGAPPIATAPLGPPVASAEAPVPRPRKSDAFNPDAAPNAPGAPQPLGTAAPSAPLARPVPPPSAPAGAPLELGRAPTAAVAPQSGPLITGTGVAMLDQPREQFNAALQAFQSGEYEQAENGFKAFMAANPSHRLTPDAVFYIGETYFQRSRPREAAEQYLKVTTDYSKSSRAPESMVRLGQTLAALGNSEQACATFTEFGKRYPTATPSVKRLAEREMTKDHC